MCDNENWALAIEEMFLSWTIYTVLEMSAADNGRIYHHGL